MLKSAENFSFPVTLSAICVMSIAENGKNFAKDRREEGRCLTFENFFASESLCPGNHTIIMIHT
jgi:hypothetical protein